MDVNSRLAMLPTTGLPLRHPVTVHWDSHHVPFIEAECDHDLALTLGVVHVHLRWAQMEVMRRVAYGRIAELLGPSGIRLDRLLRTLDATRAVPRIVAQMPKTTRDWVEAFVAGINHAIRHAPIVPAEFRLLGIGRETWTLQDIISLGRLAAFDITWFVWLALLRDKSSQPEKLWHRFVAHGLGLEPAGSGSVPEAFVRRASNSWAVAPSRSLSGAACIASDTHLPPLLPNLFLIVGYRSPSYHAVGLMTPGIPAILLGRNRWIAWGATNLHAMSSDLFDVSDLSAPSIIERRERIRVRFVGTRKLIVRETELGPIVSDLLPALNGKPYSLTWMGHRPSDELSAMLAVNAARNWQEFRAAIDGIAVPGQNMIYADAAGHIGKAMAVHLPMRNPDEDPPLIRPSGSGGAWDKIVRGSDLPAVFDPEEGFVASANDKPPRSRVAIGYLFSSTHRITRLRHALGQRGDWNYPRLALLQQDVALPGTLPVRDFLVGVLRGRHQGPSRNLAEQLAAWDGRYTADSTGALAFELLLFQLGVALYGRRGLARTSAIWNARELLIRDLRAVSPEVLQPMLARAAAAALRGVRRFRTWGAMHRVQPRHFMGRVPLFGRRYRLDDVPADGSSETLLKTAHPMTDRRHPAGLVATARHISDLSDPDSNWFVLLGGQDGWLGSATVADQVALWRRGEYVQVPLRPERVRNVFTNHTELRP
jgi:penicillin amidase